MAEKIYNECNWWWFTLMLIGMFFSFVLWPITNPNTDTFLFVACIFAGVMASVGLVAFLDTSRDKKYKIVGRKYKEKKTPEKLEWVEVKN